MLCWSTPLVSASFTEQVQELCGKMAFADHEVAILFSGAGVPANEAESLLQQLQSQYPRTEMMLTEGGQPVYDYIIVLC